MVNSGTDYQVKVIRQAHTYLVGALSGVTLIGIAIAVFVVLVSAQVFHELPIVNVSSPDHKPAAISSGKALPVGGGAVTATTGGAPPQATHSHHGANGGTTAAAPNTNSAGGHEGTVTESGAIAEATGPTTAVESPPSTGGGNSSGGNSGSHSSPPSSKSPSKGPSSSESGSGGSGSSGTSGSSGSTGTSGSTGSGTGSTGSSGSTGTGTGSGTTTTPPTGPVTAGVKSASEELGGGVNEVVTGIDENLLGGTLEETGVTEVTEGLVNGVTGPESVVGKTIDGVTETVNGLVGSGSP